MEKEIKTMVVTPSSDQQNIPVVYVLHGYSGYPRRTLEEDIPSLPELSVKYNMIFVLPDGNYDSWYIDSPIAKSRYETFITSELVQYINSRYHTQSAQKAVIGWSMGGHGAIYLGARHSEIFSAIGSICGAVDFVPYGGEYGVQKVLSNDKKEWEAYTAVSQIERLKHSKQKIFISCGYDDPLIAQNRTLHKKLLDLGIAHSYEESPGKHDAHYWSGAANTQIFELSEFFKSNEQ